MKSFYVICGWMQLLLAVWFISKMIANFNNEQFWLWFAVSGVCWLSARVFIEKAER